MTLQNDGSAKEMFEQTTERLGGNPKGQEIAACHFQLLQAPMIKLICFLIYVTGVVLDILQGNSADSFDRSKAKETLESFQVRSCSNLQCLLEFVSILLVSFPMLGFSSEVEFPLPSGCLDSS